MDQDVLHYVIFQFTNGIFYFKFIFIVFYCFRILFKV